MDAGTALQGRLVDLNRRLRHWDHLELQPEAWAFGIMDAPPVDGQVELYVLPSAAREAVASRGGRLYPPLRFEVPRSCVACVGRTGPYLSLAVGSLNNDGDPQFTKPNFHRLIMQAVADELSPVPVESQYEREVVGFFQRRRVRYHKPVFGNAEGLRPDFVLTNQNILVEVQGMNDKGYREHKRAVHQRLTMSEGYAGHRLVTYEPNEGEAIEEFERRLMGLMRPL